MKPTEERLLLRISRAGINGMPISVDSTSYTTALALYGEGLIVFAVTQQPARRQVRLTGLGEQVAARLLDGQLDEINRDPEAPQ